MNLNTVRVFVRDLGLAAFYSMGWGSITRCRADLGYCVLTPAILIGCRVCAPRRSEEDQVLVGRFTGILSRSPTSRPRKGAPCPRCSLHRRT